jgi:hypothetical protein
MLVLLIELCILNDYCCLRSEKFTELNLLVGELMHLIDHAQAERANQSAFANDWNH